MNRARADFVAVGGRAAGAWAAAGYAVKSQAIRFYVAGNRTPHFRCPPGTVRASWFTDAMGSDCNLPIPREAARSIGERIGSIGQGPVLPGERYVAGDNPIMQTAYPVALAPKRHKGHGIAGYMHPDGHVEIVAVPAGGKMARLKDAIRHVAEGGSLAEVPDIYLGRVLLVGRGAKPEYADGDAAQKLRWGIRKLFRAKQSRAGAMGSTFIVLNEHANGRGFVVKYSRDPERSNDWEADAVAEVLGSEIVHRLGFPVMPGRFDGPPSEGLARRENLPDGVRAIVMEHVGNLIDKPELHAHPVEGALYYSAQQLDETGVDHDYGHIPRMQNFLFSLLFAVGDRHPGNTISGTDADGNPIVIPIDLSTIGTWTPPNDPTAAAYLADYHRWGFVMDPTFAERGALSRRLFMRYPRPADRAAAIADLKQAAAAFYQQIVDLRDHELQDIIDRVTRNFQEVHSDPARAEWDARDVGKAVSDRLDEILALVSLEDIYAWWGI